MRTEKEMLDIIVTFAKEHEAIKVVGMEGSRVHPEIKKDALQDYDITYVVSDVQPFVQEEEWLNRFGSRIFMQKPEDMTLFEQQFGNWYSFLMLFEDGIRLDLKIIPEHELDLYLLSESLIKVLYDKHDLVADFPVPSNHSYLVNLPTPRHFDDCCNEFWWISTYVAKGLCRKEFLYATDYLNQTLRTELYRMISWLVGIETDFSKSVGKSQRFLEQRVSKELWDRIIKTYEMGSYEDLWQALFSVQELFREVSKEVADKLDFDYPDYDENITKYINGLHQEYSA